MTGYAKVPLLACGESSAAGGESSAAGGETSAEGGFPDSRQLALPLGFPAVGDWRKRKACRRHTRSVPKAYPEGEGLGVGFSGFCG